MLLCHAPCGPDGRLGQSPLQILIEREQQLGLAVIALEHDGHRLQSVERTIERGLGDPP